MDKIAVSTENLDTRKKANVKREFNRARRHQSLFQKNCEQKISRTFGFRYNLGEMWKKIWVTL